MIRKLLQNWFVLYLRILTKLQLNKNKDALIIGITGSSGKSSTRDIVAAMLEPHFPGKIKVTKEGNSSTGIPYEILNIPVRNYSFAQYPFVAIKALLNVLTFNESYDVFIVEYGIDSPNEPHNMETLIRIVKPDIALLLSVSPVHAMQFDHTVDATVTGKKRLKAIQTNIALEKLKLLQALDNPNKGYISENVAPFLPEDQVKDFHVLTKEENDYPKISQFENSEKGLIMEVKLENENFTLEIPEIVLPKSAEISFLFGLQLVKTLKKNIKKSINEFTEHYVLEPGRSSVLPGIKRTIIVDSSYNANLLATEELLGVVKEIAKKEQRRKVIVLGELRETGDLSQVVHEEVIRKAVKVADILVLTNTEMLRYGLPMAKELGRTVNENVFWFKNGKQLSFHIKNIVEEGDIVLFEGSQNEVFLEFAVEELLANKDPEYIKEKLPRMRADWLKIKKNFQ